MPKHSISWNRRAVCQVSPRVFVTHSTELVCVLNTEQLSTMGEQIQHGVLVTG